MVKRTHLAILMLILALLSSGCMDSSPKDTSAQDSPGGGGAKQAAAGREDVSGERVAKAGSTQSDTLMVKILSPKAGAILTGSKPVTFDASAQGGQGPYTYSWSSNINGKLGSAKSFTTSADKLKKGGHNIILTVTDRNGASARGSILVNVM